VSLPDDTARERIFELLLQKKGYKLADSPAQFAQRTAGYSGRELEQISKELVRMMISRANPDLSAVADKGKQALQDYTLKTEPIGIADLDSALSRLRPMTSQNDLARYTTWAGQ
jgi:SpoVK/Ycf46/Vps4 family AAA+-type ATPase